MTTKAPVPVQISREHNLETEAGLSQALEEMKKLHESVLYMVINQARTVFPVYSVAAGLCHSELDRRAAKATKNLTMTSVAVSGAVGILGTLLGAWIGANLN
jgi:hypothetical protein